MHADAVRHFAPRATRSRAGAATLLPSDANLIQYLRATEQYVARHPEVTFLNASAEGARIRGVLLP